MDFFQGSTPPNFIPFRLENVLEEDVLTPDPTSVRTPDDPTTQAPRTSESGLQVSPQSVDSETDVNVFAEKMVRIMEKVQSPIQEETIVANPADEQPFKNYESGENSSAPDIRNRTSTPEPKSQTRQGDASFTSIEANLEIAPISRTQLTELLLVQSNEGEESRGQRRPSEENTSSSVHDVPPLPVGASVVRYLTEASEGELFEESEDPTVPLLYSGIPQGSESGTEGGDESSAHQIDPAAPSTSTGQTRFKLHELSGRSRALLKEYFETAEAFRLPLGHPTVAFLEGQIYHLLKILTNETMSLTYTTMEKMILDALKGQPTTSQPRTDHFRLRTRAQTPARGDSNDFSFESESGSELPRHSISGQISDNVTSCEESDGATEMALIAASFAKPVLVGPSTTTNTARPNVSSSDEVGTSDFTSQDATLSEIREQSRVGKSHEDPSPKKTRKTRGVSRRGVPMREEFFRKIGWTRSFISGPADPLHNPIMVWGHICKRNFSIKTKGTLEVLRHHRSEKHLRRDQRWRHEHLRTVDPITGKIQHRVRGRNGKLLNKLKLADELPKFIHAELLDKGERFPFYDDLMKGHTTALVTPEARAKTQICIVADFIKTQGDLSLLRNLWARVSSFTNYQASLCDFDWGEERLTVSIHAVGSSFVSLVSD